MAEQKVRKKPSGREMTLKTRILVAGCCTACAILFIGMPVAVWFSWHATQKQQSCTARIREMVEALPKDPRVPEDSIADTERVRTSAMHTVPCQVATEAYATLNTAVQWWYRSAIGVLLLSMLPWLHYLIRRRPYSV